MMSEGMFTEVRLKAGLGDPPASYYTNVPESANALIKRSVGFKQKEIHDFSREMSVLFARPRKEVESAITNKGPNRLASDFIGF